MPHYYTYITQHGNYTIIIIIGSNQQAVREPIHFTLMRPHRQDQLRLCIDPGSKFRWMDFLWTKLDFCKNIQGVYKEGIKYLILHTNYSYLPENMMKEGQFLKPLISVRNNNSLFCRHPVFCLGRSGVSVTYEMSDSEFCVQTSWPFMSPVILTAWLPATSFHTSSLYLVGIFIIDLNWTSWGWRHSTFLLYHECFILWIVPDLVFIIISKSNSFHRPAASLLAKLPAERREWVELRRVLSRLCQCQPVTLIS